MIRKELIQRLLEKVFSSDTRFTWYNIYFEKQFYNTHNDEATKKKKEAEEATKFFEANWERVERIMSWLYDDKSKKIYERIIRYLMTNDRKYHRKWENNQYFPSDIINLADNEVFIDCGGYIADTTLDFVKHTNKVGGYKRVVIFEPEPKHFYTIRRNIKMLKNIVFIPKGVYSKTGSITFNSEGSVSGTIMESESTDNNDAISIDITRIDDVPECRDATYIKMDLEGAEWEALHGARETIINSKPKLAICIYHSLEDRLRLIEYVHQLVPDYKLYVRHHSFCAAETVLYAVAK